MTRIPVFVFALLLAMLAGGIVRAIVGLSQRRLRRRTEDFLRNVQRDERDVTR